MSYRYPVPTPGYGIGGIVTWTEPSTTVNRLFPSVTSATADPTSVIPECGSGIAGLRAIEDQSQVDAIAANIDRLTPDDSLYDGGFLAYVQTLANYYGPEWAAQPAIQAAVTRATQRYNFAKANFPGVQLLPAGSTMPSGGNGRPPIAIYSADGNIQYAPGFGPPSQYGTWQTPQQNIPPSPPVNAYTGQIGTGAPQILPPLIAPIVNTGPPLILTPPHSGTTPTGTSPGATPTPADTINIGGTAIPRTMLFAGIGGLLLLIAITSRR